MVQFFDCSKITPENYDRLLAQLNYYKDYIHTKEEFDYTQLGSLFKDTLLKGVMTTEAKTNFNMKGLFMTYIDDMIKDLMECNPSQEIFKCTYISKKTYESYVDEINELTEKHSMLETNNDPESIVYVIRNFTTFYKEMTDYGKKYLGDIEKNLAKYRVWNDEARKILERYKETLRSDLVRCRSQHTTIERPTYYFY